MSVLAVFPAVSKTLDSSYKFRKKTLKGNNSNQKENGHIRIFLYGIRTRYCGYVILLCEENAEIFNLLRSSDYFT
jgi:hypothetical protein